jgi:hypothetical protein
MLRRAQMKAKRFNLNSVSLYFGQQPPVFSYGLAALLAGAASIVVNTVPVIAERTPFLTFYFVIILSAFWLGRNQGLLTMALSLLALNTLTFVS